MINFVVSSVLATNPPNIELGRLVDRPQQLRPILGNINPVSALRNSTPERIQQDLACCRRAAGERYIVGAGCEIPRGTPHENVRALSAFAGLGNPFGTNRTALSYSFN